MKAPALGRWLGWNPEESLAKTDETANSVGAQGGSVSFGKSLSGIERRILDTLATRPATSAQLFEALADGQQTTPEVQSRLDDALDALHAAGRVVLELPDGRWHLREAQCSSSGTPSDV